MEYILFIHNNVDSPSTDEQWERFFASARQSGIFAGGSEIANQRQIGTKPVASITNTIDGYMRFETDDINKVHDLLALHPVFIQGGTLELCELPKT